MVGALVQIKRSSTKKQFGIPYSAQVSTEPKFFVRDLAATVMSDRVNSNQISNEISNETLPYITQEDVLMLQNVGVQIVSVPNRDPQPEHSQEFQDHFEAEEDDGKSDLHGEYCSTNRPVDLDLGKDEERSEKVIQMTDPLTQIVFEINASQLSQMLQKNGKLKLKFNLNSNEIKQLKENFCMAKTLLYVTHEDVKMLQNAGVQIASVTNRDPQPSHTTNSRTQEYKCIICEG